MQLRPRMVLPGFWDDYEFCRDVRRPLRYFYLGLWCVADDRGALRDSPPEIKRALFAYDDDITVAQIARWIEDLIDLKKLIRYEADGKRYLLLVNFLRHQYIARPARTRCCPLAPDLEFDEAEWRWIRIPEHYFRRPRNTPPQAPPNGIPEDWVEPEEPATLTPEPEPEPKPPKRTGGRMKNGGGPRYSDEERLIVAHFKERLEEAGVDYFDRAWHLRQLPAARRLLRNGERTVEDVMRCIDWALRLKREGRLKRSVDHLMAIEELWPRFRVEVGGHGYAGAERGAGVQRQDAGRPDGDGRPAQAGEDRRDYAGGVYGSFFGPAVPGGGPN